MRKLWGGGESERARAVSWPPRDSFLKAAQNAAVSRSAQWPPAQPLQRGWPWVNGRGMGAHNRSFRGCVCVCVCLCAHLAASCQHPSVCGRLWPAFFTVHWNKDYFSTKPALPSHGPSLTPFPLGGQFPALTSAVSASPCHGVLGCFHLDVASLLSSSLSKAAAPPQRCCREQGRLPRYKPRLNR